MLPLIALEEHYASLKVLESSKAIRALYNIFPPHLLHKMNSLGDERIQDLDDGKVSLQVISHGPGEVAPSVCIVANNDLANAISKNPTRLAGFAMLAMREPAAAAQELRRCVQELGFVGALVDNHVDGQFYDEERFWTVFETAQELDVPIYIHPCFPAESMVGYYRGNYDDFVAVALSAFGWSWHSETGLHILRLFASGVFDRFPRLKIVIGHMGELLPFQLERIIGGSQRWAKRERGLREVWRNNIWVTTSGMFTLPPLACLLQTTSIDHVLYSIDYPFSATKTGMKFVEEIEKSGLIVGEDLEKFAFKNAEKLLGVKAGVSQT